MPVSPQLFQWRRPLTLLGGGCTSWPMEGRPPPHHLCLPWGPKREMVLSRAPAGWQGWGWAQARVPSNVLAQNYIRLEVSIFCSILLPDLIVHLWQCLYTSPVQDNSVAAATGARQRCNLEINGFSACLFPGETPSLSPGSASPAPPPIPTVTPPCLWVHLPSPP